MNNNQSLPPDNQPDYIPPVPYPPPLMEIERDSALRERVRRRERQRKAGADWAWVVVALVLLIVVVLIGLVLMLTLQSAAAGADDTAYNPAALPTPVDMRVDYRPQSAGIRDGQQIRLDDGRSITLTRWNGTSRLTLLLMGLDRRPGETGLTYRTDTMMLISLDPETQSLGVLSIPRDLYVEVPGYSALQRINTPMVLGELQQTGYGPTLAMQTIQYNLGIRVQEYAVVDFHAFVTLVDALGGVDLDVPYPIADYDYPSMDYGYDPFIIQAGLQHLDGATALKYARTRHNDSDFERARRQQAVMFAIRDQLFNRDRLPELIVQSPSLLTGLSEDVYTSLNLDQMIQLAVYLRDIPVENIHTGVIDANYITDYTTDDGAQVLIPLRDRLANLLAEVFGATYGG
ncbi:MAG: LCP family protein [Anaerolineae bacterium]